MRAITASIVTYNNEPEMLQRAIGSFLNSGLDGRLYVVDNSPTRKIEGLCKDERIEYVFNNKNIGFGAGHNIAIQRSKGMSAYHLILNPDVFFETGVLENIYDFMEANRDAGLLMPRICYFDGRIQYLCKLLPTPLDLAVRRCDFRILNGVFRRRFDRYELKFAGYDRIMDVPHLSGCFMFIRRDAFDKAGLFDTRFFMYLEDVDLSRRIHKYFKTVYHPGFVAYHQHAKHSYSDPKAFMHHVVSAIRYFNKWGWFFDKERKMINRRILKGCSLKF